MKEELEINIIISMYGVQFCVACKIILKVIIILKEYRKSDIMELLINQLLFPNFKRNYIYLDINCDNLQLKVPESETVVKRMLLLRRHPVLPQLFQASINFPIEINSRIGEDFGRIYLGKLSVEAKKDLLARKA